MKKELINLFQDKLNYCNTLFLQMQSTRSNDDYFGAKEKLKIAKSEFDGMILMLKVFEKYVGAETYRNLIVQYNCAKQLN